MNKEYKINIPDGWYNIEGDNLGDGKRYGIYNNPKFIEGGVADRFFYHVLIKGGRLIKLWATHSKKPRKYPDEVFLRHYQISRFKAAENTWKKPISDLITPSFVDKWADSLVIEV